MENILNALYFSLAVSSIVFIVLWFLIKEDKKRNKRLEDTNEVLTELENEMESLTTREEIEKFNKRLNFASNSYTYNESLSIRNAKITAYVKGKLSVIDLKNVKAQLDTEIKRIQKETVKGKKIWETGIKYMTKFQTPEEVTLTRVAQNPKGEPFYGYVIYSQSTHLGECPLELSRIQNDNY